MKNHHQQHHQDINQPQPILQSQQKQCSTCLLLLPLTTLIHIPQLTTYICQNCYKQQSQALMIYKNAKPTLYPSIDLITQRLYLGNQDAACDQQTIKSLNISAICVCGGYLLKPFTQQLVYKQFEIDDSLQQQILHLFEQSYQWLNKMINQQKKIVLVHCAAGVSRSASFVIAYLMRVQKMKYVDAYQFVKTKRQIIRPNSGFVKQLRQYERGLAVGVKESYKKEELVIIDRVQRRSQQQQK